MRVACAGGATALEGPQRSDGGVPASPGPSAGSTGECHRGLFVPVLPQCLAAVVRGLCTAQGEVTAQGGVKRWQEVSCAQSVSTVLWRRHPAGRRHERRAHHERAHGQVGPRHPRRRGAVAAGSPRRGRSRQHGRRAGQRRSPTTLALTGSSVSTRSRNLPEVRPHTNLCRALDDPVADAVPVCRVASALPAWHLRTCTSWTSPTSRSPDGTGASHRTSL